LRVIEASEPLSFSNSNQPSPHNAGIFIQGEFFMTDDNSNALDRFFPRVPAARPSNIVYLADFRNTEVD
jgi:hypothetical protein